MSKNYIEHHFEDIKEHADEIEKRLDDASFTMQSAIEDNAYFLKMCQEHGYNYILIDDGYFPLF